MKRTWHYNENYLGQKDLPDPRIAIAKHLDWRPAQTAQFGTQPEPDNFNAALFSSVPLDYPEARHQVFYRDPQQRGWFTVYYIRPSLSLSWDAWYKTQPYWAKWFIVKHAAFRPTVTLLEDKPYRQRRDLGSNERLYQMEYYDRLKYKCVNSQIIDQRVGTPSDIVLNFQQSPAPPAEPDEE